MAVPDGQASLRLLASRWRHGAGTRSASICACSRHLQFTHDALVPDDECFDICESAWNGYLRSLQQLVETGSGVPTTAEEARRGGCKACRHRRLCAVSWSAPLTRQHHGDTYLVKRIGRTDGPQIVLVHGIGVASRYFRRLAGVLSRSAGVHVLELPGFGGAPKPAAPLSVEQLAAVVNDYVRSADLSRPVLVGHSMGSQVVLEASLQEPGAASTVVTIGTVVDPSARSAAQQGLRLLHDILIETPSANWAVLRDYVRTGPVWYLRTVPIMLGYRSEEAVSRLTAPLLIMRGSRDPIAPQDWVEQLRALAPDAQLVTVPGGAHVVMHSHPREVAHEILRHHASVSARP